MVLSVPSKSYFELATYTHYTAASRRTRLRADAPHAMKPKPMMSMAQVEGSGTALLAVTVPSIARWIGEEPLVPVTSAKNVPAPRMSGPVVASWPPAELMNGELEISVPAGMNSGPGPIEV